MVIKNKTVMKKEHIRDVMRADNFQNDKYKKFKLIYNLFGLLFGMLFVRFMMFNMMGREQADTLLMGLYGIAAAVFLYIGMYGMDRGNYKKYYRIYGNMVGVDFTYEIDSEGINVTDTDGDSEFFDWKQVLKWEEDFNSFFVYVGVEECLVLDKNSFIEGDDKDFKELITAVMALRENQQEMIVKELTKEQLQDIYNQHLVQDFPKSEVKPLSTILQQYDKDCYMGFGLFKSADEAEENDISGYAFIMKIQKEPIYLLDYFAIVRGQRSEGLGSVFIQKIKEKCISDNRRLILEVENPEYEKDEEAVKKQLSRIEFYKRNGLNLSNITCNFYDNEYRILYAGDNLDDKTVYEKTQAAYNDFFGEDFVREHVEFHS